MKARAILVAMLAWPSSTRAQAPEPPQAPEPGWFCMSSATRPAVDACFRARAACEERRAALSPTLPDITGCAPPASKTPGPPPPPAKDETEDLLANPRPEPAKPGGDTPGSQFKLFGIETTLSGYGDSTFTIAPEDNTAQFAAAHFSTILSARMTDTLSSEIEFSVEDGGAVEIEYAVVDWTPFKTRALIVRTGKFQIPIGKFNEQYHQAYRYAQVGRPRMFSDVVPVGWSDVGIQLRGILGHDVAFEYQAWAVNGLARQNTEPAVTGTFVRDLRGGLEDNNFDKSFGGRAGINLGKNTDHIRGSLAVSGQTGKIDPAGSERLSTIDIDAHAGLGPLTLNVEAAQTFLGRKGSYLDRFERGAYAQLAYVAGRWTPAIRWEYATQVAVDETDPAEDLVTSHQGVAPSIAFAPAKQWSVRLELFVPLHAEASELPGGTEGTKGGEAGASNATSITAMIAFVF